MPLSTPTPETVAPKAHAPENPSILWLGHSGDTFAFPKMHECYLRQRQENPSTCEAFLFSLMGAKDRIWIIDKHLFSGDHRGLPTLLTAVKGSTVHNIRIFSQVSRNASEREQLHREIVETLALRTPLPKRFYSENKHRVVLYQWDEDKVPIIHDRFAIVDETLWHFGETVGGSAKTVTAVSYGWSVHKREGERFFLELWDRLEERDKRR